VRLLVLGGTAFLGRAVAEAALARGDAVTLFTRGQTNPDLFPEAEHLRGDRTADLSALQGRTWDAVVDTSGYVPHVVRASAELLAPAVGVYVFVSSISVYEEFSQHVDEESAVAELGEMPRDELLPDHANYGALKALCEREVERSFEGRFAAVRAGLIVGPHDPTGRFTNWPHRVARGGELLAPGPASRPVQFVEVRDLAGWLLHLCDLGEAGTFNAVCEPVSFAALLAACRDVATADATVTWVDSAFLTTEGVGPWKELPLWLPDEPEAARFMEAVATRAHAAGLRHRPLVETVRGALTQAAPVDGVGLTPDRERELLARWHEQASP
jgi:2'-hydroxyisoflavone reductase